MSIPSSPRSPLLPRRHQPDLFVVDIFDATLKGDMASMEHPIFSLSTKPDHQVRRYENGNVFVEVKPSSDGLATVHDRDLLVYCISSLMAALNEGKAISQVIRFKAHDLLKATNRQTNGQAYEGLKLALERLSGTRISTNIVTGGSEEFETFGIVDRARVVRETRDGRMQEIEIKLSDWVFRAIEHKEVLTLHRDYFRLRRPIERRVYEIARKHCGKKAEWKVSLELLRMKCGSHSPLWEFKRLVSKVVADDARTGHMPDYRVRMEEGASGGCMVVFENKNTMPGTVGGSAAKIRPLDAETYHDARGLAPGEDVYALERQWREWVAISGAEPPRDPDAAFLGFCRRRTIRGSHQ
jgi:plasmid replication initiation protein